MLDEGEAAVKLQIIIVRLLYACWAIFEGLGIDAAAIVAEYDEGWSNVLKEYKRTQP